MNCSAAACEAGFVYTQSAERVCSRIESCSVHRWVKRLVFVKMELAMGQRMLLVLEVRRSQRCSFLPGSQVSLETIL